MTNSIALTATTVLVAVGSYEINRVSLKEPPTFQPVIGGFALGVGLIVLTDINAQIGKYFCILIILSSLLVNGNGLFGAVSASVTNADIVNSKNKSKYQIQRENAQKKETH